MKKFLTFSLCLLALLLCLFAFASCGDDSGNGSEQQTEPRVRAEAIDDKNVAFTSLGLYAETVTSSDSYVADAVVSKSGNYIVVTAYESGTAVLTATDYWGYTAKVTVTVDSTAVKGRRITVDVEKFAADNVANVRFYGAYGNGTTDDTKAIQSASDALKGKKDAVLLFPKGTYLISRLILWGDVTVELYGTTENVKDGYTDAIAQKVAAGEYAVIKNKVSTNIIINHDPSGSGNLGTSNITIHGGMVDLNAHIADKKQIDDKHEFTGVSNTCAICFSCGENILIDNVIFKDMYNAHAMQLCALKNTTVKDCMFAGFTCGYENNAIVTTRETIQVEYAHSGAIPPSSFEPGEFYYSDHVTITGCYFGDSDDAAYQMTCIGNHGAWGYGNCDWLTITDNVFDNPYIYAVNLLNYSNVTMTGNTFISTTPGYRGGMTLINVALQNGNRTYTASNGSSVTAFLSNEISGDQNITIKNNNFIVGPDSWKRVITVSAPVSCAPGAETVSNVFRQKRGTFIGENYSGFIKNTNYLRNFEFSDNTIDYTGTTHNDYIFSINGGYNVKIENNVVTGKNFIKSYNGQAGFSVSGLASALESNQLVIKTSLAAYEIVLPMGDGTTKAVKANANALRTLTLQPGDLEHIHLDCTVNEKNRNLIITVTCDEGYTFTGWNVKSGSFDKSQSTVLLTGNVTLEATFTH